MKLFKSLLLGSAAGLVAVSGASAADLGVKKPAAVEYVRVCSSMGAGFFFLPGSDVCMKIGGRVRAEYLYATPYTRGDDTSSFRSNGRIEVDVRQNTSYGLLRAFVRYDAYANNGRYVGGSTAAAFTNQLAVPQNTNALLDKAFIQFYTGTSGFFTAGRSASFFDFYANGDNYTTMVGSDRGATNLFAYTATFGGGFSATISAEDSTLRRPVVTAHTNIPADTLVNGATTVNNIINGGGQGIVVSGTGFGGVLSYAGQSMPDLVANFRVDQAWGSAQLSGALHQLRVSNVVPAAVNAARPYVGTAYGYGLQGAVKINLPMIAAGDYFQLQAAYSNGATDYALGGGLSGSNFGAAVGAVRGADGYVDVAGSLKRTTAWSVVGSFVHNFTPTIQGAVYAGYANVNHSGDSFRTVTAAVNPSFIGTRSGFVDFNILNVGARINWVPVRNFTIGTEVMYSKLNPAGRGIDTFTSPISTSTNAATGNVTNNYISKSKGAYDGITARLRFQRDF